MFCLKCWTWTWSWLLVNVAVRLVASNNNNALLLYLIWLCSLTVLLLMLWLHLLGLSRRVMNAAFVTATTASSIWSSMSTAIMTLHLNSFIQQTILCVA